MVNVVLALLATLAALGGAGLLIKHTLPERRMHLFAWCGTLLALGIALASMTIGYAAGFGPALLRCTELFGSLIAPLTLALGVVELIARTVQARFAARLIAASYVIVAVVIILLDPIVGTFGKSMPKVSGHYSSLPGLVLDGAHLFAVVSLVSCVAVTAVRGNRRDRQAAEIMPTLAMVALAGVLTVAAMRSYLPGPLAPLALGGSAALVWFGATRLPPGGPPAPDDEEPEPYEEMSRHQQPYDDGQYNSGRRRGRRRQQGGYDTGGYDAEGYDANGYDTGGHDAGGYDTGGYEAGGYDAGGYDTGGYDTGGYDRSGFDTGGYARPRREGQPSFAPPAGAPGRAPQAPSAMGQYGRIMIYTLVEGHGDAFDRLTAEVAHAVRQAEPGTLVYACHTVDNSPNQRLFYQLFRDANAVEAHTRQPHVQRFAREARAHVSATNVLELTVSAGSLAALAGAGGPVGSGGPVAAGAPGGHGGGPGG
ncbi:putative quinol monooxygenase, partial [Actinoallomurus acaciae]